MEDKWVRLKTLREVVNFIKENPELEEFMDKPLSIGIEDHNEEKIWNNNPQVRFSYSHGELIIE